VYVFRHRSWLVGLLGASTAGLALLAACLPTLAAIGQVEAGGGADAESTPFSGCGDGFIETLDDGGDAGESCDPGDASVPGCEKCHFVCSGAIDDAGHCYFLVEDTSRYSSAQTACANQGAHVVTLSSKREIEFVSGLLSANDAGDDAYWVGLLASGNLAGSGTAAPWGAEADEPGWPGSSNPCPGCFAVGADNDNAFRPLEDLDGGASALQCLVADRDAGWLQASCTAGARTFKTICEREPVGQRQFFCGGAYCTTIPVTVGRKRYVISIEQVTADEAYAECKARYGVDRGSLVLLETREEREQLIYEIRKRFTQPTSFWIGLALTDGGAWTWDDGVADEETTRPRPWGDLQPNDAEIGAGRAFLSIPEEPLKRVHFDTQLAYSDDGQGAAARRQYVCERPPESRDAGQ
jgi:hypothetical protein